jgi:sRNA-binding regulator protein Hfq
MNWGINNVVSHAPSNLKITLGERLLGKSFKIYKHVIFIDYHGQNNLVFQHKIKKIMQKIENKNKILSDPYKTHESNYLPIHV